MYDENDGEDEGDGDGDGDADGYTTTVTATTTMVMMATSFSSAGDLHGIHVQCTRCTTACSAVHSSDNRSLNGLTSGGADSADTFANGGLASDWADSAETGLIQPMLSQTDSCDPCCLFMRPLNG